MKLPTAQELGTLEDAQLVELCCRGNREAYGQLVERYQSLICALAYNACGDLGRSEDLAQEAFISAWRQLGQLREPDKFKSWLCGIVRNLSLNLIRRQGRAATTVTEPKELEAEAGASIPSPVEEAISAEEQAILWRALEEIPELYREPLILFYRENQSIEAVAQSLDLSSDAVKQRLSRGRQMLKEQVSAFVERGLRNSRPQKAFTVAVIAGLSAHGAKAVASVGVAAASAKGLSALKPVVALGATGIAVGSFWGQVGGWLGGLVGVAGGLLGIYLPTKLALRFAKSDLERQFIENFARKMYWSVFIFVALTIAFTEAPLAIPRNNVLLRNWLLAANLISTLVFVIYCNVVGRSYARGLKQIQQEQGGGVVEPNVQLQLLLQHSAAACLVMAPVSYRSTFTLLGLPLVHIALGGILNGQHHKGVAKGWIAIGENAYGVLLAIGNTAVGGIAFGGVAMGLVTVGGVALGAFGLGGCVLGGLAIGGCALGVWAVGGLAVGWMASGGGAVAWHAAYGGLAIAREFALGGAAIAQHANDALAQSLVKSSGFFSAVRAWQNHWSVLATLLTAIVLLPLGIVVWVIWTIRKPRKEGAR